MIIDSHCHLDYEPLNQNLDKILDRASNSGVKLLLTICTQDESFKKILNKKSQQDSFLKHIKAAQETSSTLIVHSRSAENETFDILNKEIKKKHFKILMHCFTGSKEFAKKLMNLDCYFSASGIVTFKKSKELNEVFMYIPKSKILLETDSPYLSPEPNRGKVNEPSQIIYTLKHISKIKNESEENMARMTSNNFSKLFNVTIT